MRRTSTGGQTWPLTSPLSSPTFVAGGQVRFDMNDVPAKCPTGPLAYYVPALILTFLGALVNSAEGGGTPVAMMDLPGAIIQSVEVRDVWHGVPVSSQYWLGEHLRIHEFIGSGYQYAQRIAGVATPGASSANTNGSFQVRIPLSAGEGELIRETSQLALLYQPGSVSVVMKPATALDALSTGTTWVGSVRCSLELDPRAELVLGTQVEHVLHRQVAAPSDPDIQIKGFGRSSKLTGIEAKGGVLALMELTNAKTSGANGVSLGGVFSLNEVSEYSFDWRGQKITQDVRSVLSTLLGQMGHWPDVPVPYVGTVGDGSNASSERTTFPYAGEGANAGSFDPLQSPASAWLMVMAGLQARLTDIQTADSDQTYHLGIGSNTYDTGDHLQLARYAKVWADGKRADWIAQVKKAGLDAYVLGNGAAAATLRPRAPTDKHTITADQLAFLPYQYI